MHFRILFILIPTLLLSDPWGKDADLARPRIACAPVNRTPLQSLSDTLIAFHQNWISKADGPRSHYFPSSSTYTRDAIRKYGFLYGYLLGCDRLMRENDDPWIYETTDGPYGPLKFDPVR